MVIILIFGMVLAACAPAATPTAKPPATTAPAPAPAPTTAAPAPAPTPAPVTPVAAAPKMGGTLKLWTNGAAAGYDAHMRTSYAPVATIPVFNTLVQFDPSKKETLPSTIIGDLAEKWTVSPDGLVYTFNLVKNATWHNGKPFNADDVVYSINKMLDPKRSTIYGNFAGFKDITKLDDYTVRITTDKVNPGFIMNLAHGYSPIYYREGGSVDPKSTDWLMGTGPFKFSKLTTGVSIEFVKNQNYFRKDAAGRQLPYLDGVTYQIVTDRNAQVSAVATGRLDMTSCTTGVSSMESVEMYKKANPNIVFQKSGGAFSGPGLIFNLKEKGPWQDARVRQAFALVATTEELVTQAYGTTYFMNVESGALPSAYALPTAEINKMLGRDLTPAQRIEKAKKLMADAGYKDGFSMSCLTPSLPESTRQGQFLADQLKRNLNVDLKLDVKEWGTATSERNAGRFTSTPWQPMTMLGEPNDLMPYYLTGSPLNIIGYSNPELDKLWLQQSTMMDYNQRKAVTQQIEKILLTDLPYLPQGFMYNVVALQPYVKGFVLPDGVYMSYMAFERVWLDK
jgi:peptide/nickel transport system substrate-binding protein